MKEISLFDSLPEEPQKPSGPTTCLGITFENDEARRAHFAKELSNYLQDSEFRKIEGFPIGSDADILNLSDPPYYTACPNPWINDFLTEWEKKSAVQPEAYHYHREPFATDVSEGKNDPIYNAHSYHTKVPHKAIMRYILHYTQPGDIVFDGFCGTGMTGLAAQLCGDKDEVISLGYQVKPDGTIFHKETDEYGKKSWKPFSKLGIRRAILNDLSSAATFIAHNYNSLCEISEFGNRAKKTLKDIERDLGWMYETKHKDGRTGEINYVVWSDVFICPSCNNEVVFWEVAVEKNLRKINDKFDCPQCSTGLSKRNLDRAWVTKYDEAISDTVKQVKQFPVLINYSICGKRFNKTPDDFDLGLIKKIETINIPYPFPTTLIPKGDKTAEPLRIGITHAHHFYTRRNLFVLSALWFAYKDNPRGRLALTSVLIKTASLLHNIGLKDGKINLAGALPNAMYIPSNLAERNLFQLIDGKIDDILRANLDRIGAKQVVTLGSLSSSFIGKSTSKKIDYVFIDPPFGANLQYSELSFLWEAWLGILTNNEHEAIESKTQGKNIDDYRLLMTDCFKQAYESLRPGKWMTVEFSNTSSSVWNSIQSALSDAGFVVGNVSALHKGQGTFNAQTNPTSVKQDLVISAYKPNGGFEERFQKEAQTKEGVWDFVRTHLKYLPVSKRQGAKLQFVAERDPRILFDQMVAYYVRKDYPVPISSQEFQAGLMQRFIERDGMFFLPDQVAEYDRKKMTSGELKQETLFVSDEASAIRWIRQLISEKPQAFSEVNPQFMQQLGGWSKNEAQFDLRELLNQNFLIYDGKGPVPEQIHAYLSTNWKEFRNLPKDDTSLVAKARERWYVPDPNKAADLEKLREKALLMEFEEYIEEKKKLKVFRLEAVRAGFKKSWQERDYAIIVAVAAKLPGNVLEGDPKLLMWYDQAVTRMGGE